MSSKKITDADKLEITRLYRQSGDTTASLASRYGVSNSTISRLLKTSIPEAEYEVLIQQKRGSKAIGDEEILTTATVPQLVETTQFDSSAPLDLDISTPSESKFTADDLTDIIKLDLDRDDDNSVNNRRVRRRSSAPVDTEQTVTATPAVAVADEESLTITPAQRSSVATRDRLNDLAQISGDVSESVDDDIELLATAAPKTPVQLPSSRTPVLRDILADSKDRYSNPPPPPVVTIPEELDEDNNDPEDVNLLAAMFGEEIADGDDDDDEEDDDTDLEEDGDASSDYQQLDRDRLLTEDRLHVQVKPLSEATLPRTCYIVIDKFAELIVRPLKDFADLGQISGEETQQRTLPVFDNHRVAKRFSNQRTQRVIKVPDSRIFYKTTQHLRSKGITCLLVDGNIYSLN